MKRYIRAAIRDILQEDWKTKQDIARDSRANPRDLVQLAEDNSPYTRQQVAHNLNTPPDTLRKLARDPYPDVRAYVKLNPSRPKDLLVDCGDVSGVAALEFFIDEPLTEDIKQLLTETADVALRQRGLTKISEQFRKSSWSDDTELFYYILQCGMFDDIQAVYDSNVGGIIERVLQLNNYWVDGYKVDMLLNTGE